MLHLQVKLQQLNKIPIVKLMLLQAKRHLAHHRRQLLEVRLLMPLTNQMPHTAKPLHLPANQVRITASPMLL
jgi:hypothetical protein